MERTCLLCIHWCICRNYVEKGREWLKNSPEENLDDFFHSTAKACDEWQKDLIVAEEVRENRLIKEIIERLQKGEVAVFQKTADSFHFAGFFSDEPYARFSMGEDSVILKASPPT